MEGYLELSAKTKTYFVTAVALWDADFYVKVDDDVHVNIGRDQILSQFNHILESLLFFFILEERSEEKNTKCWGPFVLRNMNDLENIFLNDGITYKN